LTFRQTDKVGWWNIFIEKVDNIIV
jgi:hypothetical protein